MSTILNGKHIADKIAEELRVHVCHLKEGGVLPKLVIFASKDSASEVYIRNKVKRAKEIGIEVVVSDSKNLKQMVDVAPNGPYIVQLPTQIPPSDVDAYTFHRFEMDMDGFGYNNMGRLSAGKPCVEPCTPKGIIRLLNEYDIPISNQRVVIVGRSNIVGKPLSMMLTNMNATVTLCHTSTDKEYLHKLLGNADIVVSAVGKHGHLNNWESNSRQTLIDVGINVGSDGKLCGDFTKENIGCCRAYTPVPGGVGPMTVISLMENVVRYYGCQCGQRKSLVHKNDPT